LSGKFSGSTKVERAMAVRYAFVALVALCSLTACGTEPAPPAGAEASATSAEIATGAAVILGGGGLMTGGKALAFSTDRAEAEAALSAVLGQPDSREENGECGAGPMQFTQYPGGLTANFQDERLVGWYFDTANPKVALENGITVGTERARIAASPEFMLIPESTLGEEFALGDAVGGFIEGDKVASLYAGVNCFFR
jgi:hypothetical protein